jgi:hypothetical protein
MLSAEQDASKGDIGLTYWQVRMLMTLAAHGGKMRLNWDNVPPSFRDLIGDLHQKGLLRAVEACESDLQIAGTVFLLSTDGTSKTIDTYQAAVRNGRAIPLTPFSDDVKRIIKA